MLWPTYAREARFAEERTGSLTLNLRATLAVIGLLASGPALAQQPDVAPEPVPIEEWSLEKVSAMGVEIHRQDSAAWRATDRLLETLAPEEVATVRGWIIVPEGDALKVRFLKAGDPSPLPGWDVVMTGDEAGPVTAATEPEFPAEQLAQVRAQATARANVGALRCSASLNTVVIADPDTDGWLVWLLTPTGEDRRIPLGGHYRFRISADGSTVLRRDQLSNTCFFAERPPGRLRDAMLFFTQIVSRGPVETQVFLSIQNQITIVVSAGDRFYSIGGARIGDITDMVNR